MNDITDTEILNWLLDHGCIDWHFIDVIRFTAQFRVNDSSDTRPSLREVVAQIIKAENEGRKRDHEKCKQCGKPLKQTEKWQAPRRPSPLCADCYMHPND